MMSQTPLDVSGKLHAEPAELEEEEESSDEEPTPKKQKSTRSSKKVSPFLFFLDISGMLSSNDDVSFPCSGMSLELSRSRTMSRRRSPRRAPRRPRVRSSNGWRSRRTSRRRRRRKRNQNYLLFVFLDAFASRMYFILIIHDENVSYICFFLLMKNKEQAMIPFTCG